MERLFVVLSFVMTGLFPLFCGLYLALKSEYFVSIGCLLTSVCGFQQVYHNLKNKELFEILNKKILEQQVELESCQEEHAKQRKETTRNLADLFGMKMADQQNKLDEQERTLSKHRSELTKASAMLEQKNNEIWKLKNYD